MAVNVSSASVCQTVVSDCSFVSSLAISGDYEKRFKKRILTNCIFPQDKTGAPQINDNGSHLVYLRRVGFSPADRVFIDMVVVSFFVLPPHALIVLTVSS